MFSDATSEAVHVGYGAKRLLQHRPHVPGILANGLLQDGVPVENCEDVVTATDNVLAYIFTRGTKQTLKMLRRHQDIPQACLQMFRKH